MIPLFKKNIVEPTHRRWTIFDELEDFWVCNKNAIGVLIIAVCIVTLIFMMGYAAATGHIHLLSTEANVYEHLAEVI